MPRRADLARPKAPLWRSNARTAAKSKSHHCFGKAQADFEGRSGWKSQCLFEKSCTCQDLEHIAFALEDKGEQPELEIVRRGDTTISPINGRRVTVQRAREPFFTSTR